MSNKQFINNLSATYADVRKLDVKKINLKGKNILEYIKESVPTIKHSQDTRETVTENDLWGQYIETTSDGTIIIHDDEVTNPNASDYKAWDTSITKVEDDMAYTSSGFYANIQTEKIKDGTSMFEDCVNLTTFTSDLSSLTYAESMFDYCTTLTTFTSDLSSLTDAPWMFYWCENLITFDTDLSSLTNSNGMFSTCENLESFTSDLSSLTYGESMFAGCYNLINFNCGDLSSLTNGESMFEECTNLTTFTSDLSSLTYGSSMFSECTNLTTFNSDLSSLMNGSGMFYNCATLTSFNSDLSGLTNGESMFEYCDNLTSFDSDLPNLTNGNSMFVRCTNLTSFSSDLSNLTNGYNMFMSCSNLTSFNTDLSNLTYSRAMFQNCTNLISFISVLSNLIDGTYMFRYGCLNAESVMYIVNSINDITAEKQLYIDGIIPYVTKSNGVYSAPRGFMQSGNYVYTYKKPEPYTASIDSSNVGKLTIGINVTNDAETIQQQLEDFAKEAYFDSWAELKQVFVDKGWTVTFQYGGTSTNITLSEDEKFRGIPVYARLIEVTPEGEEYTEEEKASAEYCTEDGTKYYNIDWGHDVTDYDQYQYFGSLLEACGYYGVIPKKYLEV